MVLSLEEFRPNPAVIERHGLGDFVERHSRNGRYSLSLAMEAILSCLTPDIRAFVIYVMEPGKKYTTKELTEVLRETIGTTMGFGSETIKTALNSFRGGFPTQYSDGLEERVIPVRAGILNLESDENGLAVYSLTTAGALLFHPVVEAAIQFVNSVHTIEDHEHDCMERILGQSTLKRAMIISALAELPLGENGKAAGSLTQKEIIDRSGGLLKQNSAKAHLKMLDSNGIIEYEYTSPHSTDRKARATVTYRLADKALVSGIPLEELAKKVSSGKNNVPKERLEHALQFIMMREDREIYLHELQEHLIRKYCTGENGQPTEHTMGHNALFILNGLSDLGVLTRSESPQTRAAPNWITWKFNRMVLEEARSAAMLDVSGMRRPPISTGMLGRFLQNGIEEYGWRLGKIPKNEVRRLEDFIRRNGPVSIEEIVSSFSKITGRKENSIYVVRPYLNRLGSRITCNRDGLYVHSSSPLAREFGIRKLVRRGPSTPRALRRSQSDVRAAAGAQTR